MKRIILSAASLLLFLGAKAQSLEDFTFGFSLSQGTTLASVKDDNPVSSRLEKSSDGLTTIDENGLRGGGFKLNADYAFKENLYLSTGVQYSKRRLNIKNEDGSYVGTSVYHVNYLHIPIMVKYRTDEVIDKLRLSFAGGPTLDLKVGEKNIGSDYAHYMNFAQNRSDIDPERGGNGNDKSLNLFNRTGLSLMLNAGAEYEIKEKLHAYAGFSYQQGLSNMLNGRLKFDDEDETKLKKTLSWRSSLLAFDIGISFAL